MCTNWELHILLFNALAQTNVSGHAEMDYPHLESYFPLLEGLPSVVQKRHIPLPAELLQEFQSKYNMTYIKTPMDAPKDAVVSFPAAHNAL